MNRYHHNGALAVTSVEPDNFAGFGARRFMQDVYQPYGDQSRGVESHSHHAFQPSVHGHDQGGGSEYRHYYHGQSMSQTANETYLQDSSMTNPAPRRMVSSYNRSDANDARSDHHYHDHQHYQEHPRFHQTNQHTAHLESQVAAAALASQKGASSRTVWRSDSLNSSATDSTGGLAYARSGDSQYSRRQHLKPVVPTNSGRSVPIPQIKLADRATIYDDGYEEPVHATTADIMPRPPSPALATLGDVSTEASFTIVRATVLEPDLPRAKCADCGEKLDFEELASHSCQPLGTSRTPLLTIQVPPSSSSSTLSSTKTSPAVTTPRSPFFDRYETLVGEAGPLNPVLFGTAVPPGIDRDRQDDDETPKAHAVRIFGTQTEIKVSNIQASPQHAAADSRPQEVSRPVPPPALLRSASDAEAEAAAARRKMIEEQRAAKRQQTMASAMPRAATTSSLSKQGTSKNDRSEPVPREGLSSSSPVSKRTHAPSAPSATEVQHAKTGSSSSLSSTGTDSSERMGLASKHPLHIRAGVTGSYTADMTPSTSYERFNDGVNSGCETPTKVTSVSTSSKQARVRGCVDLSGIEEMMKGLTTSPEPLQRTLADVPPQSGLSREAIPSNSQRPRSATEANKTDRERALELELERLRDKERTRQLQAIRLKEKRKKERATKRCCVCDCSLSSSRTSFVERDGKLLCARDWKELYLPKCRKCNLSVERGAVKSSDGALRGVFHRECFSCAACEAPFADGSFYVFNNQPYCSRHYHRLNGSLCRECEGGIEGDCRQTDTGDRFHPHCFSCQYSSENGACIEPLADYYNVGGQRLCERHANKVSRRLAKAGQKQLDLRAQKRMTMLHSLR